MGNKEMLAMPFRFPQRATRILFVAATFALITACSGGSSLASNLTPTPATQTPAAPTATTAAQPTATTAAATGCAGVSGFSGAGSATAGPGFSDVPFPAGSVSTPIVQQSSGTGLFTVDTFNVCSPGTSKSAVQSFYASQMVAASWVYAPTVPYDGGYQAAC